MESIERSEHRLPISLAGICLCVIRPTSPSITRFEQLPESSTSRTWLRFTWSDRALVPRLISPSRERSRTFPLAAPSTRFFSTTRGASSTTSSFIAPAMKSFWSWRTRGTVSSPSRQFANEPVVLNALSETIPTRSRLSRSRGRTHSTSSTTSTGSRQMALRNSVITVACQRRSAVPRC